MFVNWSGWNAQYLYNVDDLPQMLPTKFLFIWPSGFREDVLEINQSETRIVCGGYVY